MASGGWLGAATTVAGAPEAVGSAGADSTGTAGGSMATGTGVAATMDAGVGAVSGEGELTAGVGVWACTEASEITEQRRGVSFRIRVG